MHHGVWDYDPPAAPILHDITVNGRKIKAVTLLTKQDMSFVFDRVTGKPVWPIEERPVPHIRRAGRATVADPAFPDETRACTRRSGYHEDDLIDFTPELRAEALAIAEAVCARADVHADHAGHRGRHAGHLGISRATAAARTGTAAHSIPKPA